MKDIYPPNNKRSIRNFNSSVNEDSSQKEDKISGVRSMKMVTGNTVKKEESLENTTIKFDRESTNNHVEQKMGKRWVWWLGGIFAGLATFVVVGFGFSSQFATADLTIKPMKINVEMEESIIVKRDPRAGELGFEIMSVKLGEPRKIKVNVEGEEEVENYASGFVTIHNNFDTNSQDLVATTRFESPEGYIFRIRDKVTVPGMKDGQSGILKVKVYADEPGEDYNISSTRFTVPGFAGSPRFDDFYAVSDSSMEGGMVGVIPVISDEDSEVARNSLREGLEEELFSKAFGSIPEGFILFEGAYSINETSEIDTTQGQLILDAHLSGVLFKKENLAEHLYFLNSGEKEKVEIMDWDAVNVSFETDEVSKDLEEIKIDVSGEFIFVRKIDKEAIAKDLSGVAKRDSETIESIFNKYPIESADAKVSPFWVISFPAYDKINVILE